MEAAETSTPSKHFLRLVKPRPRRLLTLCGLVTLLFTGFALCFSLSSIHGMAAVAPKPREPGALKILVFGGNGFIGSATVSRLVAAGHEVATVNRGNWYWDSGFVVKPFVTQVTCDRLYALDKCKSLVDLLSNGTEYDVVIDFSAYHVFAVTQVMKVLNSNTKLYLYISTDSVYDVCDKNHSEASLETDAVRPQSQERQKELEAGESYGHRKLEIEEELSRQRNAGGPPFVSLRLPDVIGPRDNTYRWWIYQVWMKLADHLDKPLAIPSYLLNTRMSLVYVNDVADTIVKLLNPKPEVLDQAYNLAFSETPTLFSLLSDIKTVLNITDLPILTDNSTGAIHMFPSVKNGPVDISKAQQMLDFVPTPLSTAVKEIVEFYEKAMRNPYFHVPRKEIIRNMQAHFTSRPFKVLLGLKKHYGLDFQIPKDEL